MSAVRVLLIIPSGWVSASMGYTDSVPSGCVMLIMPRAKCQYWPLAEVAKYKKYGNDVFGLGSADDTFGLGTAFPGYTDDAFGHGNAGTGL